MKLKYLVGIGMAPSKEQTGYNLRQKPKKYILLLIIPKAYKKIPCKSS